MKRPLLILAVVLGAWWFAPVSTYADSGSVAGSGGSIADILPEGALDATIIPPGKTQSETIEEINAFIIKAYTARVDRIIADLRRNIADYPAEIQIRILKQVRMSINEKIEELDAKDLSAIRRTILMHVLEHVISELQKDIRRLETPVQ